MCSILFWVPFALKLLKLGGLIADRHFEAIYSHSVGLGIRKERLGDKIILVFDVHLMNSFNCSIRIVPSEETCTSLVGGVCFTGCSVL